ncbi:MAG: AbrB/MazE/SpoVT family DNA-binding domain-containing protein [archaeon]|nr:AbrB/MazE/SpoVT family DNA-binding domain-containing protein [archaeon]
MEKKEIKCHLCGGKAILKFDELKLDEGKIVIKNSPYYECQKCKEKFSTSEQMQELSEQINTKFSFKRPIINAGRSLAITLPADLVEYYDLKKGEKITLIPEGKKGIKIKIA